MSPTTLDPSPFDEVPVEEIPLARAPLVRVLAQVRFANMSIFKRDNFINPFLEALSGQYPLLEEGHETELVVGPAGVSTKESSSPVWRVRSLDSNWVVTVSPGSLAIETGAYLSRNDFLARFQTVITSFTDTIGASVIQRVGIRYTNQILDDSIGRDELVSFFRPSLRGALSVPVSNEVQLRHSILDALFSDGSRNLQGRWGLLPPGGVFDPSLPPVQTQTWFLDIDCFAAESVEMTGKVLIEELAALADREYRLFRFIVTDEFIAKFKDKR